MNQKSTRNAALLKVAKQPRKLRGVPSYKEFGMKDPTKEVKKANPGLDNTKKKHA